MSMGTTFPGTTLRPAEALGRATALEPVASRSTTRRARTRTSTGSLRQECQNTAPEPRRAEPGRKESRPVARRHIEPARARAARHMFPPRLQVLRQRGEIAVVLGQTDRDRALQV